MNQRLGFAPEGLSESVLEKLSDHSNLNGSVRPDDLLASARAHLANIRSVAEENPFINTRLAEGIVDRLHAVAANWDRIPPHAQAWMKAAMAYFADTFDEVPDLASPIGFEDDCEVLNACLRFAEREDSYLDPADFDEF
ncbi:hypothetical protein N9980_00295 [bacterium]|nr:hypothetical protein [bacterium]